MGSPRGTEGMATAQLPADDMGILQVPGIITYGAPGSLIEHFNTPSTAALTRCQPYVQAPCGKTQSEHTGLHEQGRGWRASGHPTLTRAYHACIPQRPCMNQHRNRHFALGQVGLRAQAVHQAQPHRNCLMARCWSIISQLCLSAPELPAYHSSITQVPGIVQHTPPRSIQEDLHSAVTVALSISQPQGILET